jgi:hypothetical protein
MSSSSAVASCLDHLFSREFVLSDWKKYFESTRQVLGDSGAICFLPAHAKFLDCPKFVHSVFIVKHPTNGLVAFQICSFDCDCRIFVADSLEAESITMSFSWDILHQIPFVNRSRLLDLIKKVSSEFGLSLGVAHGLSCSNSQDGGVDFVLGSPSETHYQFHVTPVSLSSSASPVTLAEVAHHGPADPTKTAPIKEIPPAVCEVLFAGKNVRPDLFSTNRAFTHFYSAISANLWLLPGEEGSRVRDARLHVAVPKTAAIMCLNVCWISLGHFRTEDNEQRVADAFSMSPPQLIDLRIINSTDALEAWDNCRDVLDRLFLLTSEFKTAWSRISSDMSEVIRCSHQFVDIRCNGAVYDILDHLGLRLFQHMSNPSITVEQVRLALSEFRVVAEDRWFVALYDSAQRRYVAGPPGLTSISGVKRVVDESEHDDETAGRHPTRPCFNFFSTNGCSARVCRFSHGPLSVEHKTHVLAALASQGRVPDADKV